jgi:hypothetical protein
MIDQFGHDLHLWRLFLDDVVFEQCLRIQQVLVIILLVLTLIFIILVLILVLVLISNIGS